MQMHARKQENDRENKNREKRERKCEEAQRRETETLEVRGGEGAGTTLPSRQAEEIATI